MPSTSIDRIDGLTTSVAVKAPVRCASAVPVVLYGEQTVAGVALVAGDRVLIKSQDDAVDNGIYYVSTTAWERAPDFDGNRDVVCGTRILLAVGSTTYRVTSPDPIVIGVTPLTFEAEIASSTGVDGPVVSYISYSQNNVWSRAPNLGAWSPTNLTCAGTVTYKSGPDTLATKEITATLNDTTGTISVVETGATGQISSVVFHDSNTAAPSATVTYNGLSGTLAWASVQGGMDGAGGVPGTPGAPGAPGADGTSVKILGTLNNVGELPVSGDIGDGYIIGGDLYGADWVNVGPFVGPAGSDGTNGTDGAPGAPGADGVDGLSVTFLTIYKRSIAAPATPTGGSYNFDTLVLTAPAGWTGAIPSGYDPVYVSHALASIQGITGTDSSLTWTTPVIAYANGADGADGALAWAAADVQMGAMGDITFYKNQWPPATPYLGLIAISGTAIYFRGGASLTGLTTTYCYTPYHGAVRATSVFYVFANRTALSNARFGSNDYANTPFFVAEYVNDNWYALGYWNTSTQFVPNSDDAIIGIGSRPSMVDDGIRTLASFVVNFKFNVNSLPIFMETASITSALIQTLVADKIAAGNLTVAMNITTGNLQVSSSGKIYSGKSTYGSTTAGFFLGMDGGIPKLNIGDASKYVKWDGSVLQIGGDVIATGNIIANAVTGVVANTQGVTAFNASPNWTVLASATITTTGAPVDISSMCEIENISSNNTYWYRVRLRRDADTLLASAGTRGLYAPQQSVFQIPYMWYDVVGAGTYTYTFEANSFGNVNTAFRSNFGYMRLMEIKR
jgi:hypothetical protein